MSEPTLCEIHMDVDLEGPQVPLAHLYFNALLSLGVLVPVKPDYEAAWGYARQEDNGHIAARNNDNMVVLDKYDVMAAVDAALGIGGDDGPILDRTGSCLAACSDEQHDPNCWLDRRRR